MSKVSSISGPQLQTAMLRRQISIKALAQKVGVRAIDVKRWLKKGVPEARCGGISTKFLDDVEHDIWGAHHMDMFPDLIPDDEL